MNDFLTRMARSALGLTPTAKVLAASRYVPGPEVAEQVVETEAPHAREEPSPPAPRRADVPAGRIDAIPAPPPPPLPETASRPGATIARAAAAVSPPPRPASAPIETREPARAAEPIAITAAPRPPERMGERATRPPRHDPIDAVEVRAAAAPSPGRRAVAPGEPLRGREASEGPESRDDDTTRREASTSRHPEIAPAAVTTRPLAAEPAPVPAAPPQRTPSSPLVEVSSRRRPSSPGRPSSRERPSARPLAPPVRGRRDERVPETPAEPPSIRVTIGRVEVRAVSPPPPAEPPPPAKPRISLDDYLRSHRGRSR